MSWQLAWKFALKYKELLAVVAVAAGLAGYIAHLRAAVNEQRQKRIAAELAAENARVAEAGWQRLARAGGTVYVRGVFQEVLEPTEAEADAGMEETVARGSFEVAVPETDTLLAGSPVEMEGDIRTATWQTKDPPYRIWARAMVPPPGAPTKPNLRLKIGLDPLTLNFSVGCGEPREGQEIRPAVFSVRPSWDAPIEAGEVHQSPEVCNPGATEGSRGLSPLELLGWSATGGAAGFVAGRSPEGAAVGIAIGAIGGLLLGG